MLGCHLLVDDRNKNGIVLYILGGWEWVECHVLLVVNFRWAVYQHVLNIVIAQSLLFHYLEP